MVKIGNFFKRRGEDRTKVPLRKKDPWEERSVETKANSLVARFLEEKTAETTRLWRILSRMEKTAGKLGEEERMSIQLLLLLERYGDMKKVEAAFRERAEGEVAIQGSDNLEGLLALIKDDRRFDEISRKLASVIAREEFEAKITEAESLSRWLRWGPTVAISSAVALGLASLLEVLPHLTGIMLGAVSLIAGAWSWVKGNEEEKKAARLRNEQREVMGDIFLQILRIRNDVLSEEKAEAQT